MPHIKTNFDNVPIGQDISFVGTVVDSDGNLTTDTITSWTLLLEIRTKWSTTTATISTTSFVIDNTAKTVTATISKASSTIAQGKYYWQCRRTNSGSEGVLGDGEIWFGIPPPSGTAA